MSADQRLKDAIRRGCAGAVDIDDIVEGVFTELLSVEDERLGWLLRGDLEQVIPLIQVEHAHDDDGYVFHEVVSRLEGYDDDE